MNNPLHVDDRTQSWFGLTSFCLLSTFGFTLFECRQFVLRLQSVIYESSFKLTMTDYFLTFAILLAKTWQLLIPLLVLCGGLIYFNRKWSAHLLAYFCVLLLLLWFAIDLRVKIIFGNGVSSYLGGVQNRYFTGDLKPVYLLVLRDSGLIILGVILCYVICNINLGLSRVLLRLPAARWKLPLPIFCCVALMFCIVPWQKSHLTYYYEQVHETLPICLCTLPNVVGKLPNDKQFVLSQNLNSEFENLLKTIKKPISPDETCALQAPIKPNVVFIIVESLRSEVLSPRKMPRLHQLADMGANFVNHYAGSNCSSLGTYGLLYARHPLQYNADIAAKVYSQACVTFKKSGYETALISSCRYNIDRMDNFMSQPPFDQDIVFIDQGWVKDDQLVLEKAVELLQSSDRPQFLTLFLMSTHFNYEYPPQYARHFPDDQNSNAIDVKQNRYWNSVAYMDDILADFLEQIDFTKTIVVFTGDHGESLGENGVVAHGSRLSEVETHVPMVMWGPRIQQCEVMQLSVHADVLPTVLHFLC